MGILLGDRKVNFADIGIINSHNFLFVAVQNFNLWIFTKIQTFVKKFMTLGILGVFFLVLFFWSRAISLV